ncbi:MAG TPA: hypothetical protein PKY59_17075 [Pyrinomonadaceae bacterium]|nr:hypothetical protein [Pyrinomonadaceae bacterium]
MTFRICKILLLTILFSAYLNAQTISFSPDAQTIAVNWFLDLPLGSDASQFLFYDAKLGKSKSFFNYEFPSKFSAFTPDSKSFVFADRLLLEKADLNAKGEVLLIDNLQSIANFAVDRKNQDEINSDLIGFAVAPDGKVLYKVFPNFLTAFSLPDLKHLPEKSRSIPLSSQGKPQINFAAISSDARFVVETEFTETQASLIVKETAKADAKIKLFETEANAEFPTFHFSISQNNEVLMVRTEKSGELVSQVETWDLKTKKSLGKMPIPMLDEVSENQFYSIDNAVISPDGKKAAARFDFTDKDAKFISVIAIYDAVSKKTNYINVKKDEYLKFADALTFSPDSKQIATLSSVLGRSCFAQRVELWNAEDGKKLKQFD